jgi:conjugative transfer signal peptidase TraF
MGQPVLVLSLAAVFSAAMVAVIARFAAVSGRIARAVALAAITTTVVAISSVAFGSRLRINFTPSMPLGIYRLEPLPAGGVAREMFVAVCAPDAAADLGGRRGYLATGPCPHDTEPLLKIIAGVPGDDVAVAADGVAVDGCLLPDSRPIALDRVGRRMLPWPWGDYRVGRGQVWLYAGNPRSWDSRYWGPGAETAIVARAVPLLVAPTFRPSGGQQGCAPARSADPALPGWRN